MAGSRRMACQNKIVSLVWRRFAQFAISASLCLFCIWNGESSAQIRENKDYCSNEGKIVIALIDVTTPYGDTDRAVISRMLNGILESVRGGDRIIFRTIADSYIYSERLIDKCKPYCQAATPLEKLFNCADGLIKADQERLKTELFGALHKRLAAFEPKSNSDIIRTIQSTMEEDSRGNKESLLYIYSDLIENSELISRKRLFLVSNDGLLRIVKKRRLYSALRGVQVHVVGVGRDDAKITMPLPAEKLNKLIDFWKAYFNESGAKSVSITHDLPSGN